MMRKSLAILLLCIALAGCANTPENRVAWTNTMNALAEVERTPPQSPETVCISEPQYRSVKTTCKQRPTL